MERAAAHQLDEQPGRWGQYSPWALSVATHAVLVVVLAILCQQTNYQGAGQWFGPSNGMSLLDGSNSSGSGQVDDGGLGSDSSGNEYYNDDPGPAAGDAGSETGGGEIGVGAVTGSGGQGSGDSSAALASLLSETPEVDLTGVLPAGGTGFGQGQLEGGGVGSASASTSGSGRSQGHWPRSGSAHTGVFGVGGEGHKFVYVFDRSGSMDGHGGAPLAAAKSQLIASLEDLGQTHQFQIIFYNEHPRVFNPTGTPGRLVFATDQNRALARKFIGGITADGSTEHEDALVLALQMAPDVIFFLTDADEPRLSAKQMQRIARLNRGTSINAIEFGFGPQVESDNFLVRLAQQNAGHHVYVDLAQLRPMR
jgi:hypothetical protein